MTLHSIARGDAPAISVQPGVVLLCAVWAGLALWAMLAADRELREMDRELRAERKRANLGWRAFDSLAAIVTVVQADQPEPAQD